MESFALLPRPGDGSDGLSFYVLQRASGDKDFCRVDGDASMSEQAAPAPNARPALPDVNAQTYPFDFVQQMLDETANFSMLAVPVNGYLNRASLNSRDPDDWFNLNGGYGLDLLSDLHRFEAIVTAKVERGLKVNQEVGCDTGKFHCLCLFTSPSFGWHPKQAPPPAIFDPWRSQHFVVQECELTFGGENKCKCYGVGRTFPLSAGGRHILLAGAICNLVQGTGKFECREGTLVLTGTITPEMGFLGNINLRVRDDQGTLVTEDELLSPDAIRNPDPDNTFVELRLIKKDKHVKTTFGPPPGDGRVSLVTPSVMRSVRYSYVTGGRGPRTHMEVGQLLGVMDATVFFDLAAPAGTADSPVPFTTQELYTFNDNGGGTIGTISCAVVEGWSFGLKFPQAPGQPGVRFAGFGPITGGAGQFAGVQGMLTVNSLIGIAPHTLSLMHVLHLVDPKGKFRVGGSHPHD